MHMESELGVVDCLLLISPPCIHCCQQIWRGICTGKPPAASQICPRSGASGTLVHIGRIIVLQATASFAGPTGARPGLKLVQDTMQELLICQ